MSDAICQDLCDLPALMVASEKRHVCWKSRLEQHQQRKRLQAIVASIHEISQENVARLWDFSSSPKELQEVMELPMDVSTHLQSTPVMPLFLS